MDNYRGISLLSVLGKVFTFILNKRLTEWTDSNDVLSDAQAGFRKTYSTTDHIFTLYACIEKYMLRNGKFYVAYVDFSKAFDTVQHPILWNILLRAGVKGRMIRILKSMYSTIKACVRCGSSCTEYFDCLQGLKQGCLLSPTLFSLFINELAHDMTSSGRHGVQFSPNDIEIFIMLFADDIILMSATIAGLQNQLNVLHDCTQRLHLNVNLSKTKVMIFRKGGHLSVKEQWVFGNQRLEVVNSYKYLGFIFSTKLSFDVATNGEHLTRARRGTFEIIKTLRKLGCSSPSLFFKLFDAQIVPSLLYGSELWGIKARESIEKVHIQACKLFLNVPPHTPNDMVYGELGRFPLYI